jgi:hypothetical protein
MGGCWKACGQGQMYGYVSVSTHVCSTDTLDTTQIPHAQTAMSKALPGKREN